MLVSDIVIFWICYIGCMTPLNIYTKKFLLQFIPGQTYIHWTSRASNPLDKSHQITTIEYPNNLAGERKNLANYARKFPAFLYSRFLVT